jgi:hypothetical protein
MRSKEDREYRKIVRNFKGRVDMMNRASIETLEAMFLELHEFGLNEYIKKEREKQPNKTRKEIIIDMYKLHDKLKNSSRRGYAESL